MELKSYQLGVLQDLENYLQHVQTHKNYASAFNRYWEDRLGEYDPIAQTGMRPYQNNVKGVPQVCVKVPTAGGKTFIAVNALRTIFEAFDYDRPKAVVWLVPWSNLLDQTYQNLSNPAHPYRQKLSSLFNNRVQIYRKHDLLQASNFGPATVREQLSVFVMSFGSLRTNNKDGRKAYEENGALAKFTAHYANSDHLLPDTDETALINVIRSLSPVVVVDESHNAESELSVDMLRNLNPSFILDLTATPKKNANVVSFVPAIKLKENNMVKLPVIVHNHREREQVIESSLHLQRQLELMAQAEEKAGGRYIRPIVLFQAQPRTGEENVTFQKIKATLLKLNIPENQIKIKTADLNELKNIDLMSRDCEVRYIITVNALKEGWDCPFAYVLASLADKSSAVDVEQILGRILRQPYVMKHQQTLLNLSYVITASAKFNDTLQNIVRSLESAGFSKNDYRATDAENMILPKPAPTAANELFADFFFGQQQETTDEIPNDAAEFVAEHIQFDASAALPLPEVVQHIAQKAETANQAYEQTIAEQTSENEDATLLEMKDKIKTYALRHEVEAVAQSLRLPQFCLAVPKTGFWGEQDSVLLSQEALMRGFNLAEADTQIDWETTESELYQVDLQKLKGDSYTPAFLQLENRQLREPLMEYLLSRPREGQIKDLAQRMMKLIGDMYPIPDQQIKTYIERILESFNSEKLQDLMTREYSYRDKIKQKIKALADVYSAKEFHRRLDRGDITVVPKFAFKSHIAPVRLGQSVGKSLYEREGEMNNFELQVITRIASLDNIVFWHRNLGRGKGFSINGFKSDHYPDFIVYTQSGKIILVETKGDDRDNSDSDAKNKLGRIWAKEAGPQYRYCMVFEHNQHLDHTYTISEVMDLLKAL